MRVRFGEVQPIPTLRAPRLTTPQLHTLHAFPWPRLLLATWLTGALVLSFPLLAGSLRLRRLIHRARAADVPAITSVWTDLRAFPGLSSPARLLISAEISVPLVTGLLRPVVLLPAAAAQWPAPLLRAALLHELAHLARHDLWSAAFARLVASLYWFHPLAWAALRSLRAEAEMAADDFVVTTEAQPIIYAESLVTLIRTLRAPAATPFPAIAILRGDRLESRLERILNPALSRHTPRRAIRWCALAGVALATAGALVLRPVAADPPTPAPQYAFGSADQPPAPFAPQPFRLETGLPSLTQPPTLENGVGVRLDFPLGPVRIDYGTPLPRQFPFDPHFPPHIDNPGPGYRQQRRVAPAAPPLAAAEVTTIR
jgi:beta-lactamase regulating signal transducer with metallopeptidase domain